MMTDITENMDAETLVIEEKNEAVIEKKSPKNAESTNAKSIKKNEAEIASNSDTKDLTKQEELSETNRRIKSRQLAAMSAKKTKKSSPNGNKKIYHKMKSTLLAHTQMMERYLDEHLQDHIFAIQNHIPLYQFAQNDDQIQELVLGFHKEIQGGVKQYFTRINAELDLLIASNPAFAQRMNGISASEPLEYEVNFTHPYAWDYLELISQLDSTLNRIEQISLTGLVDAKEVSSYSSESISVMSVSFRALKYISSLRIRRGGSGKEDIKRFKVIVENYRNLMVRYE